MARYLYSVCFLLLLSASSAFAQSTFTSSGIGVGSWTSASSWTRTPTATGSGEGQDYPGPNDIIVVTGDEIDIDATGTYPSSGTFGTITINGGGYIDIKVNSIVTCSSISIVDANSDMDVDSGVTGSLTVGGSLTLGNTPSSSNNYSIINCVSSTFPITINGSMTLNGTTSTRSTNLGSSFTTQSGLTVNGNITTNSLKNELTANGALTVTGTTTISASSSFTAGTTLTLSNSFTNSATLTIPSTTSLVINGAVSISGWSSTTIKNFTVNSGGSVTLPSSLTTVSGDLLNNSTLSIPNTLATISGNVTNNGALTASSGTTNIGGNFSNSSTFNHNSGTIVFNGTSAQVLSGITTFNNITSSNSVGVTLTGTANLEGVLNLSSSGKFTVDSGTGSLVVKSTSANTSGSIGSLTTPTNFISNNKVTVESFISGISPDGDWKYLSVPITNANLGMWKNDSTFPVTGNFSDATTPAQNSNVISATASSVYTYNGTAYVAVGGGGTTSSQSLSNTTAYSIYDYNPSNTILSVTGNIAAGGVSIGGLTSGQYNLVPNPYPSNISWSSVYSHNGNFSNTVYIRKAAGANNSPTYATYVANAPSGTNPPNANWTGEIALGQSFWVNSTSGTSLGLVEGDKTSTATTRLRVEQPDSYFKFRLYNNKQQFDEAMVWFNQNATMGRDTTYDGLKKQNDGGFMNLSTYTEQDASMLAINGIPLLPCDGATINLKITNSPIGAYKIAFNSLDKLYLGYSITLVDNFLKQETAVTDSTDYDFNVTSDSASTGANRFVLKLLPLVTPVIEADGNTLEVTNEEGSVQWFWNGKPIVGATSSEYEVTQSGTYTVQLTKNGCSAVSNGKIMTITGLEKPKVAKPYPNPSDDYIFIDGVWDNAPNEIISLVGTPVKVPMDQESDRLKLDVKSVPSGIYVIKLVNNGSVATFKIVRK